MDGYVAEDSLKSLDMKVKLIKLGCFVEILLTVATLLAFM